MLPQCRRFVTFPLLEGEESRSVACSQVESLKQILDGRVIGRIADEHDLEACEQAWDEPRRPPVREISAAEVCAGDDKFIIMRAFVIRIDSAMEVDDPAEFAGSLSCKPAPTTIFRRFPPDENAEPAPVKMAARTLISASSRVRASISASTISASEMGLRSSG